MNSFVQAYSLLLLMVLALCAEALFREASAPKNFGTVVDTRARSYRRLHEILSIGDDPNEDIRTNILLNMEGL